MLINLYDELCKDNTISIEFSLWHETSEKTTVFIEKVEDGAKVHSENEIIYDDYETSDAFISEKEWKSILVELFDYLKIRWWDDDSYIKDNPYGFQWDLIIHMRDNSDLVYQTKEKLPEWWTELIEIFYKYARFMEFSFYKNDETDQIWHVEQTNCKGPNLFSFDRKKLLNLWTDYPQKFTKEEKELFDKENPFWAEFFSNR